MRPRVRIIGYGADGGVVYTAILSVCEYYDGEHPWDRDEDIQALHLTRLIGEKIGERGEVREAWESRWCAKTGVYLGSAAAWPDGTTEETGDFEAPRLSSADGPGEVTPDAAMPAEQLRLDL